MLPARQRARSDLALCARIPSHRHRRNLWRRRGGGKAVRAVEGADHRGIWRLRQPGRGLAAVSGQRRLEQALPGRRRRDERRDRCHVGAQRFRRRNRVGRGQAWPSGRLQRQCPSRQSGRRARQNLRDHEDRRKALSELPLHPRSAGCTDRDAAGAQSHARTRSSVSRSACTATASP